MSRYSPIPTFSVKILYIVTQSSKITTLRVQGSLASKKPSKLYNQTLINLTLLNKEILILTHTIWPLRTICKNNKNRM